MSKKLNESYIPVAGIELLRDASIGFTKNTYDPLRIISDFNFEIDMPESLEEMITMGWDTNALVAYLEIANYLKDYHKNNKGTQSYKIVDHKHDDQPKKKRWSVSSFEFNKSKHIKYFDFEEEEDGEIGWHKVIQKW